MVETVTIKQEPQPDSQEHIDAMVAKAEGATTEPVQENLETPADDRPEWLPEKFKTPEDLAKSYAALEKKMSSGESADTPATPETEIPTDSAEEAVENAGLDFDSLQTEYQANQGLTDDTYDSLAKSGIPREVVDSYIAGQEQLATSLRATMFDSVGGEEAYGTMMGWASTNLTAGEVDSYNKTMNSGDTDQIQMTVHGLKARYQAANGSDPKLISGDTTAANAGGRFESVAQLTEAMRDPRYAKDSAFRNSVQNRLSNSSIL
tara:strand:- start:31 stop:819 length:789 start_codon:yes stop_codon:yes gene_type:complete